MNENQVQRKVIVSTIKCIVKDVLGIEVIEENQNLVSNQYHYPVAFLLYVIERLANLYGEEIYDIFREDDERILQVSSLADAIMKVLQQETNI